MFKRLCTLIIVASLLLASLACGSVTINTGDGETVRGSGNVKTEQRSVSGFSQIALAGVGRLEITQGDSESLEIEAEDNILAIIETKVEDGILLIKFKDKLTNIQPTKSIIYRVTLKELVGVQASGAGDFAISALKTSALDVQISGAGNVVIDSLEADNLSATIAGAGNFEVKGGKVDTLKVDLPGLGAFRSPDMQVRQADLTITGAGSARLWVTDLLDVQLSGVGGVEYYGQPAVTKQITGLGAVTSLGDHP